jgi:hypothetical protein
MRRLGSIASALVLATLWSSPSLRAQQPQLPASTIFEMTGFLQNATLDNPGDPFSGGTLTMNNHLVVIPRYTIFQMPATSLTWTELFTKAPAPWGPAQSGLALNDTPAPDFTFEVTVQGNRVIEAGKDRYIAGLVFISNLSVQAHQGFISAIDYAAGEFVVGGARVRLNDPIGRFGRVMTHDARFTIDEDNPTVKTETGYPVCLPRTRVDQSVDDPLCPQGNRIPGKNIFTMLTRPAPTAAERNNPALRNQSAPSLDPWRAAPLQVGDYVTVRGPIVKDGAGQYISAYAVDANVGIYTAPGTQPSYVSIDVILMGTGPLSDATLAQEGARRTRVEGFTTDFTTPVMVGALDIDACTGQGSDRLWNVQAIDAGPPTGAVAGRWRFRPGAPLFDLKGFPFLPPTREVHVTSLTGTVTTLNGLSAGEYTAPNFEFILPENRDTGTPIVPGNFEAMPFLAQGSGPRGSSYTGQLDPWPGDAATRPVRNACAVVGADFTVKSGTAGVTLDGSQSVPANVPTGPVTFKWTQLSGTAVTLTNATTASAKFTAPAVAVGATAALTFKLTVTPGNGAPAVDSRFLTVTVNNPDVTPPTATAPTALQGSSSNLKRGTQTTLSTTATDNVGVAAVTFFYSYTLNGVKQTGTAIAPKPASGTTWSATFTPSSSVPGGTTYTFTAVASDAAGNQTTSAATSKAIQ